MLPHTLHVMTQELDSYMTDFIDDYLGEMVRALNNLGSPKSLSKSSVGAMGAFKVFTVLYFKSIVLIKVKELLKDAPNEIVQRFVDREIEEIEKLDLLNLEDFIGTLNFFNLLNQNYQKRLAEAEDKVLQLDQDILDEFTRQDTTTEEKIVALTKRLSGTSGMEIDRTVLMKLDKIKLKVLALSIKDILSDLDDIDLSDFEL